MPLLAPAPPGLRAVAPAVSARLRIVQAPRTARTAVARPARAAAAAAAPAPSVVLKVDGMICSKCSDRVRNVLAAQAGVAAATADYAAGSATATAAPGAALDAGVLAAVVTDAGFDAVPAPA